MVIAFNGNQGELTSFANTLLAIGASADTDPGFDELTSGTKCIIFYPEVGEFGYYNYPANHFAADAYPDSLNEALALLQLNDPR